MGRCHGALPWKGARTRHPCRGTARAHLPVGAGGLDARPGAPPTRGAIDQGLIADRAAVARKLGLTRARVTQLLDLLLLAPDLHTQVIEFKAVDGAEPLAERTLQAVAHTGMLAEQRAAWAEACRIRADSHLC